MLKKRIGIALLLCFLVWRSANSVYVLATNRDYTADWQAGLSEDTESRIARALDLPPGRMHHLQRYQLLRDKVPPRSEVMFLHEFKGEIAVYEISSYFRLSALIYPSAGRMIDSPPQPRSVVDRSPDARGRFVLDLRHRKTQLSDEFTVVGKCPGAVLWREGKAKR